MGGGGCARLPLSSPTYPILTAGASSRTRTTSTAGGEGGDGGADGDGGAAVAPSRVGVGVGAGRRPTLATAAGGVGDGAIATVEPTSSLPPPPPGGAAAGRTWPGRAGRGWCGGGRLCGGREEREREGVGKWRDVAGACLRVLGRASPGVLPTLRAPRRQASLSVWDVSRKPACRAEQQAAHSFLLPSRAQRRRRRPHAGCVLFHFGARACGGPPRATVVTGCACQLGSRRQHVGGQRCRCVSCCPDDRPPCS